MIVKNEEQVLARCLDSVKDLVDEIIIVDTGSTDRTKDIATFYTDNVYDFKWIDDFSAARNFAFSKGTKDYLMWLDADDVILEEDRIKFKNLKEKIDYTTDIYNMQYNLNLDKDGNPGYIFTRARLFKREKNYKWIYPIHEYVPISGKVENVDIAITHKKESINDPGRNLRILSNIIKSEKYSSNIRFRYLYAKELYNFNQTDQSISEFEKIIEEFKNSNDSFLDYLYPAFITLSDSYKKIGQIEKSLETLLKVLKYDIPPSECCCKIGDYYMDKKDYLAASFWNEMAIENAKKYEKCRSNSTNYDAFTPYINLCVCYWHLGDKEKSYKCNEEAGKIKPNNPTYLNNKAIFE